jgi:type I restriction enzyme S subunit
MKQGWEIKKLSEIGKVYNGNSINEKVKKDNYADLDEGFPFIATKDISYESVIDYDNGIKIPFSEKTSFKTAPKNTVLICAEGGSAGRKIGFTNQEVCFGNKLFAITTNNNIESRYVYYYYFSSTFQKHFAVELAGIIGGVSMNKFKDLEIPVPSLTEQQRIVSILDEAFAAIAKAKANAEQNLKNAKELFESYLQGVFENGNWEKKPLKELTLKIGSGATPRGGQENYKSEGISLVRSMNVHDWEFRERNLAFIDEKQAKELDGVTLQEYDVLLNITGASVARCCVFPKEYLPARVNQHVSIIRPKKDILDARFLNLLLTSKPYKDQLLFTGEQGATRQAITKAQIETFQVAFPSLKEQNEIVKKLDNIILETNKLETIYQQKINDLEELKKSVLQKAFAGELKTEKELA